MDKEEKVFELYQLLPTIGEIFRERFTGAIRIDSEKGTRVFYFKEGNLISIGTTIEKEKIDEILIKEGKITREHVKESLEKSNSFAQIGKQLISFGFLREEDLEFALKKQANIVLENLIREGKGKVSFIEGHEPTRTDVFLYPTHLWILDFITSIEDRGLIFQLLPPLNHLVGKEPEIEEFLEILPWNEEDKNLVLKLNGSITLSEITSFSNKKEIDIYKKIAFLNCFGVIKSYGESPKKLLQEPLFTPLEIEKEVPPPPLNIEMPIPPKYETKKKKIYFVYPVIGSVLVILFFSGIFLYYAVFSKPKAVISPPKIEKELEEPKEEESDTMKLIPQEILEKKEKPPEVEAKSKAKEETKDLNKATQEMVPVTAQKEEKKEPVMQEEAKGSQIFEESKNYLKMAMELPKNSYTIQILIACQEETIIKLRKQYPSFSFWFVPFNFKGKNCYKVFYETFKTKEEAEKEREKLPEDILKAKPQIVFISNLLKDISQ